jgi:sensor histidine kinase YesM
MERINKEQKNQKPRSAYTILSNNIMFNLFLWVAVLLILTTIVSLNGSWPFEFHLLYMISALPAMLVFTYSMNYYARRLLFTSKKPGWYIFLFVGFSVISAMLVPLLHHLLFFNFFYPRVFEPDPWFNWKSVPQNLILIWVPYFILSVRTFFMNWFKSEKEKLNIENKQLLAEIQLMKIKLHPHFLFNTLNNLYAMAATQHVDTPDYILKLSEIYRIMLYECNKEYYPLHEEIKLISNYIELEKIRYDKRLELNVDFPDTISEEIIVPPLLFFTFVENSFKHGCRNNVDNPFINISIRIENECIIYESQNSIPDSAPEKKSHGGIGLDNTGKRLELIYKDKYEFESGIQDGRYKAYLKIPVFTFNNKTQY